jgi:hypothetical protein
MPSNLLTDCHNKKLHTRKAMEHWNAAKTISFLIRSSCVASLMPISKYEDLISTQYNFLLRMVASMQYVRPDIMQRRVPLMFPSRCIKKQGRHLTPNFTALKTTAITRMDKSELILFSAELWASSLWR